MTIDGALAAQYWNCEVRTTKTRGRVGWWERSPMQNHFPRIMEHVQSKRGPTKVSNADIASSEFWIDPEGFIKEFLGSSAQVPSRHQAIYASTKASA